MGREVTESHDDIFQKKLIQLYIEDTLYVTREWLEKQIEEKLGEESCRFVLLTGEPGVGKTALMASLAANHPNRLRYFLRSDSRSPFKRGQVVDFFHNIGLQLASLRPRLFFPQNLEFLIHQQLQEIQVGGKVIGIKIDDLVISPYYQLALWVEQEAARIAGDLVGIEIGRLVTDQYLLDPERLQYLTLLVPAQALLEAEPDTQIVILVDALDELYYDRAQYDILTWLTSCSILPSNIRFVLTSRPDNDRIKLFKERQQQWLREIDIGSQTDQIQDDLRQYIHKFTDQFPIRAALAAHTIPTNFFIKQAKEKAEGNFLYLRTLFEAIKFTLDEREQLDRLLKLQDIPSRLQDLYALFLSLVWERVFSSEAYAGSFWRTVISPIFGILAVAEEPLTATQIEKFGALEVGWQALQEAFKLLQHFLEPVSGRYFLYHSTFSAFLTDTETKRSHPECYFEPDRWHQKIISYYKGKALSWREVKWNKLDQDDLGYGLRHIATHMTIAGMSEDLYMLVATGEKRNEWADLHLHYEGSYVGFLLDLDLLWNWVSKPDGWNIGHQVRCILIRSSIYSLVSNIIPDLLPLLIKHNRLTPEMAFAHVQQMPKVQLTGMRQRSNALIQIAPFLSEHDEQVLQEAEAIADEQVYLDALCALVPHLTSATQDKAIDKTWEIIKARPDKIAYEEDVVQKIISLWNFFPSHIQTLAFQRLQRIQDEGLVAYAFVKLASSFSDKQRAEVLERTREMLDEYRRLLVQARFAEILSEREKAKLLLHAQQLQNLSVRLYILLYLIETLEDQARYHAVNVAWETLQRLANEHLDIERFRQLLPHLLQDQKEQAYLLIQKTYTQKTLPFLALKAQGLFALASVLPETAQDKMREEAQDIIQQFLTLFEICSMDEAKDSVPQLLELFPDMLISNPVDH